MDTAFCRVVCSVFLFTVAAWPAPGVPPENVDEQWHQWRGPQRDGSSFGESWPADLRGLRQLWRVELGKGYPGPIVTDDHIFIAETVDDQTEAARALDRQTGRQIWQTKWKGSGQVPFFAKKNGDWIRSTPVFDGVSLFVGSMQEKLIRIDAASGEIVWQIDFPQRFGTKIPDFGFASSPLVVGDHIYVQAANSLVKLDKESGETVWRAFENDGNIMKSGAFSSPVIATIGGVEQIVAQSREALFGVRPESGEILWSQEIPSFRGMHILTPTVYRDTVFTSPYKQKSFLYHIERNGNQFVSHQAWTNKAHGYMSSPVMINGDYYLHLGNGRLVCIDWHSGQTRWTSSPMGKYWSIVTRDEKILGLSDDGRLHLLQADPRGLAILDQRQISDQETWGHLAVQGNEFFVRELMGIVAFEWASSVASETPIAAKAAVEE